MGYPDRDLLSAKAGWQALSDGCWTEGGMTAYQMKIARVEQTLRRLQDDVPQLALRVKDLSAERQKLAKAFAASMIDSTRAELERLRTVALAAEELDRDLSPCEPAD